jgi:predicted GNAT family N-acyltransferase
MSVRVADYEADYEAIRAVRYAVFVDEQNVPSEIEMDERDPFCVHLLAIGENDEAIGTVRIDLESSGKIGRLAVLEPHRRQGVGNELMRAIHEIAALHDLGSVWCHAQLTAVPFYEQLGYVVTSEPFDEAGIEHVTMRKILPED